MENILGVRKIYISNLKDIEDSMSLDLTKYKPGEVCLDLELKEYTSDICESLALLIEKCNEECGGVNASINLDRTKNHLLMSEDEWLNVLMLEDAVNEKGFLCFYDIYDYYETEKVANAYSQLRCTAEYIKSKTDSPLERFLMAYDYVSSFIYRKESQEVGKPRSIVEVLNGFDIVCVGYSELLSCLCKELGITCFSQNCIVGEESNISNHRNNLVFINDEKYNIHTVFHCDACWDSLLAGSEPMMFYNFCLIPPTDIKFFKDKVTYTEASKYIYDEYSLEEMYPLILTINDYDNPVDFFGLDFKEEDFKRFDNSFEFNQKLKKATETLISLMKKNGIKYDDYKSINYASAKYIPKVQLVLLLDSDENIQKVDGYLKEFKKLVSKNNKVASKDEKGTTIVFGDLKPDDVYLYLKQMKNNENGSNGAEIEKCYENYQKTKEFKKVIDNIHKSIWPISMDKFYKALIQVRKYNGMDDIQAKKKAKQAVEKSAEYSEHVFSKGTRNCFFKKAKGERKSKGEQ